MVGCDFMNIKMYNRKYIKIRILKNNGVCKMAVLATNKPNMFAIKEGKMKDFIKESNDNKITNDFLEECRKASKLFRKK